MVARNVSDMAESNLMEMLLYISFRLSESRDTSYTIQEIFS